MKEAQPTPTSADAASSPASAPLDGPHLARLRRDLGRKGMEVNGRLTKLLAGMNARLLDLKMAQEQKPGLRPEEKLRRYLDQIIRAQRRLGTPDWGKCVTCGATMAQAQLDDSPWKEECDTCLATEATMF